MLTAAHQWVYLAHFPVELSILSLPVWGYPPGAGLTPHKAQKEARPISLDGFSTNTPIPSRELEPGESSKT